MKYDPQNADRQVQCPACGWVGNLDQTEDQDVLTEDFEHVGTVCICPKCGTEVVPSHT